MAYADANDAAFRLTGFSHGAAAFAGRIGFTLEKAVVRETLQTDGVNYPEARPTDNLDSRTSIRCLDYGSVLAETTTKNSMTISGTEADGGAWSLALGTNYLVGGFRIGFARRNGGNPVEQDFDLVGAFTFTPSM